MEKKTRRQVIIYCILFVGLIAGITAALFPYVERLSDSQFQKVIEAWIDKRGITGFFIVMGIQILQVVIAFIPGEPVEIFSGALYGAVGGLLICLSGCMIASTIIFSLSKRYGNPLLYSLFGKEKVQGWKWLQDSRRYSMVTFILFFVPGTPKDMLTYIVGITNMGGGEFIGISTLARIPSILSSTIIGSTIRQDKWIISLSVFLVTGIIGIVGIGFKERIICFCQSRADKEKTATTKCEGLDFVEAAHRQRVYPFIYCHMEFDGDLDISRLQSAIARSCLYVPEVLYTYDFTRGCFVDKGFTASDTVCYASDLLQWELEKKPQLQIVVNEEEKKIIIGMSHILTDGEGFLQYLYLLSFLYSGHTPIPPLKNCREISPVLDNIHIGRPTEQTRRHRRVTVPPLRENSKGHQHFCLSSRILPKDFSAIYYKSKKQNVTLNDVFLAAYARVISRLHGLQIVVIPCPADLRRYSPMMDRLSIANMTGIYRKIVVEIAPQHSFRDTLLQVHIEMELQKSRRRCFVGIRPLNYAFHRMSRPVLAQSIKYSYRLFPVSYTNFGKIDHTKLAFKDCKMKGCFMTGTYRLPPDFQLSISTYQNVCTLNCTLIGQDGDDIIGQQILDDVKNEMLEWVNMN
ncbi:VTT domain-containing protein [Blautia schinkii]|nr:VTT domain-containing protein [Blautia schinkii]